ncbi:caspase-2-like [Atheta coriaria]|uniref:caspase-2-like n=1 Tax=Dalotia coriaria TaxID=877792 RepID=UPI0031F47006
MLPSVPPTPPIQTFRQYKTQSIRGPLGLMLQADNTDRVPTTADTPHISILIKKGTKLFIPEESHIPMYRTNGKIRGKSLIINNIKFKHKHTRDGAHNDSTNMFNLLKALDLNPKEKNNLTAGQISKTLQHFSNNSELDKVDICFIVIMSYGKGSVNDMTEIYGVDEGLIKVHDIISHFASNRCKKLAGKPKVFIFQCSRDSADNKGIEFDARPPTPPPHLGDMLIAYSTMPGFPSGRNLELGSYYIREICNVFMRHACDLHLEDMFKIIENNLKNRTIQQHTSYENKSFQNCYLNPK